jgi:hypothetical protein
MSECDFINKIIYSRKYFYQHSSKPNNKLLREKIAI